MANPLSFSKVTEYLSEHWQQLPDFRKPSNNTQYEVKDAALAAYCVFFMQSPSFLAHQRDMHQRKGKDNAIALFDIEKIPSDNQIRKLLDPILPDHFHEDFAWLYQKLADSGQLANFQDYKSNYLVALDGVVFHSSEKIHCSRCTKRQDSNGTLHYYHSAILPVMVKPGSKHVLSLAPEFVVPQDGHEKQDCERAAAKRWLAHHHTHYQPHTVTFLGDDLYANQPLCELIVDTYQQNFVFVCKPASHKKLYEWLATLEGAGGLHSRQARHWNGRHGEIWSYRFVNQVPLRGGQDAQLVNWLELTITHEETGKRLYFNSWVTNQLVTVKNVAQLAKVGRTRWKVENENINVLKTKGYNLDHNFGHGTQHLANVFFSLNVMAFLMHTAQYLLDKSYRLLCDTLAVRRTFFNDVKALTRYLVFDSWDILLEFMLEGLELKRPVPD
jgi:hypothetical protein